MVTQITAKWALKASEYRFMRVAPVSPTVRSQLLSIAQRRTEPKGAVLFRRNEPALGIFLVRTGSVGLRLEGELGKSVWGRTATAGSIVGLPGTLSGDKYSLSAVTMKKADLAFVDRSALLKMIKCDPCVGLELMRALGDEIVRTRGILASARRVRRQTRSRSTH